jgi:hypothetical protein
MLEVAEQSLGEAGERATPLVGKRALVGLFL